MLRCSAKHVDRWGVDRFGDTTGRLRAGVTRSRAVHLGHTISTKPSTSGFFAMPLTASLHSCGAGA